MTLGNVTHVFGNWLAGPVREFCMFGLELPVALQEASAEVVAANLTSYGYTFGFAGVITLLPLLLLFFVRPQQIDNARQQDEPD